METQAIESEARGIVEQARGLVIDSGEAYTLAGTLLTGIKGLRAKIAESCDPVVKAAHAAHKAAVAQKTTLEAPLVEAEGIIKPRIGSYLQAEERKRREEEARLQAAAQKAAEDSALAEAEAMEKLGDKAGAAAMIEAPVIAPVVVLAKSVPKVSGVSMREAWAAEITDLGAFLAHVVTTKQYGLLGELDMTAINGMARAQKALLRLPGVRAVNRSVVSSRASA
jgi:colicin import membrane protein